MDAGSLSQDQRLSLFNALRNEILNNERLAVTGIVVAVGQTAAIIGLGGEKSMPWVFLAPIPFLWAIYIYVSDKGLANLIAAAYVRYFIEPFLQGIQWETQLAKYRKSNEQKEPILKRVFQYGSEPVIVEYVFFVLIFVALLSLFIGLETHHLLNEKHSFPQEKYVAFLLAILGILAFLTFLKSSGNRFKLLRKPDEVMDKFLKSVNNYDISTNSRQNA